MNGIEFKREDFSKFADFLGMGFYRVTREGKFIECDSKTRELLEIPEGVDVSEYSIADLYAIPAEREMRIQELKKKKNEPLTDTLSLSINGKNILFFDICWFDKQGNLAGLIREVRESNLLRSLRAVEEMPTAFYHVEHAENDEDHDKERITLCNDRFAQIHGFKKKEDAIGKSISKLFHPPESKEKFFKDLYEADERGEPLRKYPFETKKLDGTPIHLSLDVRLVKDSEERVIGREGTIRDVTDEIELKKIVVETQANLERTTADINKFIHTFLHPVVKFSGNSELLYQLGDALRKTSQPKKTPIPEGKELGEQLMECLTGIRNKIHEIDTKIEEKGPLHKKDGVDLLKISTFKEKLIRIIYQFDYSLKTEESELLLDSTIKDTALWVLDELNKINFSEYSELEFIIREGFIEFLHKILFSHLVHIAGIMKRETEIMKDVVEALRAYIGLQKERKYSLVKSDLEKILEENIEHFKPTFLEKGIEIDYKFTGNLEAELAPNDIDRVVCNLLHNAGKYSSPGKGRFIKIRAREIQPGDQVEFSIENFGTPIKKEEIESESIFKFGIRGELAFKSDRDGTGVGLADAKDTVEYHGGELNLTSNPVREDGDPREYKVPYLTKVTIRIPKKSKKERSNKWR